MKTKIKLIFVSTLITLGQLYAQDVITVNANSEDISENFDLESVAYMFGEADDLEKFEVMLNDPEYQISNLDLNNDGYVDYLRVVEANQDDIFVVTIQAVIGQDLFQDVATIDVDASSNDNVGVQIVGDEYLYGTNYIIEPVYIFQPVIFDFFRYRKYVVWNSPYCWNYFPAHYSFRKPHSIDFYRTHVYGLYHNKINYRYVSYRKNEIAGRLHKSIHRNDFAVKHPHQSFSQRNNGCKNKYEWSSRRSAVPNTKSASTGRQYDLKSGQRVQTNWNKSKSLSSDANRTGSSSVSVPIVKSQTQRTTNDSDRSNSSSERRSVTSSLKESDVAKSTDNLRSSSKSEQLESKSSAHSKKSTEHTKSLKKKSSIKTTPAKIVE
jgi:hypothetical protein